MFYGCAGVNVKNGKYLNSMFEGCIALKNDLNKFNTNIVIYPACFIIVQDYPLKIFQI